MMYAAMQEGRISNPVILEIDIEAIGWEGTLYSDRNATRNDARRGDTLADFSHIHFNSVTARNHFDLDEEEQPFYQAEVLVRSFVPLQYITNIQSFGIPVNQQLQAKQPYTAQITRKHYPAELSHICGMDSWWTSRFQCRVRPSSTAHA